MGTSSEPTYVLSPGAQVMRLSMADLRQFLLKRPVMPGFVMLRELYVSASYIPVITASHAFAERMSGCVELFVGFVVVVVVVAVVVVVVVSARVAKAARDGRRGGYSTNVCKACERVSRCTGM